MMTLAAAVAEPLAAKQAVTDLVRKCHLCRNCARRQRWSADAGFSDA
jgi:hypothetical protein